MVASRPEHGAPRPCPGASLGRLGSAVSFTDGRGSSAQGLEVWGLGSQWPDSPPFQALFHFMLSPRGAHRTGRRAWACPPALCAPARAMCVSRAMPACWEFRSSLPELCFLMCARGLTIFVPRAVGLSGPGWHLTWHKGGAPWVAGKSSLHLIGQIPKTSGCVVSVGSMEVSMSSISLQRKHLQGLDPREPTGPRMDTPLPGGTGSGWERAPVK